MARGHNTTNEWKGKHNNTLETYI